MNATQRIAAGVATAVLWLAAIVAKHFYPDISIEGFTMACASALSALGIHSATKGPQ
jgi:hypothetical protein